MADAVTQRFVPGFRLIDGTELNNVVDQVNNALDGTSAVTALDVTGDIDAGGDINATGNVTTAAYASQSLATGLTAAGNNRATGLQLAKAINIIGTAAASTGVVLPLAADVGIGGTVRVFNAGANAIKVYALGSETIDGTAGSTGVTLTNALRCEYIVTSATAWVSAQLGAVSA